MNLLMPCLKYNYKVIFEDIRYDNDDLEKYFTKQMVSFNVNHCENTLSFVVKQPVDGDYRLILQVIDYGFRCIKLSTHNNTNDYELVFYNIITQNHHSGYDYSDNSSVIHEFGCKYNDVKVNRNPPESSLVESLAESLI